MPRKCRGRHRRQGGCWTPGRAELASDSDLEQAFNTTWERLGCPDGWEWEVRPFPTRKIRFDFSAGAPHYVAAEIDGGTWVGGRHVTGTGFDSDCEKANLAAEHGWRAFRLTASMLSINPAWHLGLNADALGLEVAA